MPTDEDNPRYKPTTGKPAAKPSTVNDPDNPNAARNAPPATSRPGFQQGGTRILQGHGLQQGRLLGRQGYETDHRRLAGQRNEPARPGRRFLAEALPVL